MSPTKAARQDGDARDEAVVKGAKQMPLAFLRSVPEPQRAELLKREPVLRSLLRAASKGAKSISALSDGRHDRAHASR